MLISGRLVLLLLLLLVFLAALFFFSLFCRRLLVLLFLVLLFLFAVAVVRMGGGGRPLPRGRSSLLGLAVRSGSRGPPDGRCSGRALHHMGPIAHGALLLAHLAERHLSSRVLLPEPDEPLFGLAGAG
eukprot:4859063-Pyramimonas_sp.AAC.1